MTEMVGPLLPTATFIGAAIRRFSAGTLAKPAPRPNTPPKKPMAANAARPAAVRRVRQSMRMPAAGSSNSPLSRSSSPSASDSTTPKSAAFMAQIIKAMAITVAPSAICRRSVATDSPTTAPASEAIEPASASGKTSRRFAIPVRNSTGPAANVPESANSSPTPRTKSRWKGKKLPTMGTNSTPPPTPASTATMPMMKLTANSAIGQIHHGSATPSAAVAGADAVSARTRTATCIKRRFFKLCSHYAEARREFIDAVPADRFSRPLCRGRERRLSRGRVSISVLLEARGARGAGVEVVLHNMPRGDPQRSEHGTACLPGREARFRDDLEIAVRYARAAGCRRVHCMAGIAPPGADHARLHATYVSNLKYAAQRLADEGMQLLIEPLSERTVAGCFLTGSAQAARTLEEVAAPNAFIQYDLFHMQIMEGNLAATIERLLPRIGHMQLADVPGRHEPGTGEINFTFLLAHIDRVGYSGWMGCEYNPKGDTLEGLKWAKPYL